MKGLFGWLGVAALLVCIGVPVWSIAPWALANAMCGEYYLATNTCVDPTDEEARETALWLVYAGLFVGVSILGTKLGNSAYREWYAASHPEE